MKDPKVIGRKAIIGPVRLAYCHLLEKYKFNGSANDPEARYSACVMIPKTEKATVKALQQAIEAAKAYALEKGMKLGKNPASPLKDGDDKDAPEFAGHWLVDAKANRRPGIVNRQMEPLTDEDDVYSGMWAMVSMSAYPYSQSGNNGVAFGLDNVMKWKDDERLGGGGASAESDFSGLGGDDEEDLL